MSIPTTCIGAYPKPDFVRLPDWFNIPAGPDTAEPTRFWNAAMASMGDAADDIIDRGVGQVIQDQVSCGIDVPSDGEVPRENYIHYHCRHLNGFDFVNLTERPVRGGNYQAALPTINAPVSVKELFLTGDWQRAQRHTDNMVKITMPGPMTIADTNANEYYDDPRQLSADLAQALNKEVLALAAAGCRHIQIDEPLFARRPDDAIAYGVDHLEMAFHGCPPEVTRTVHMCCGYPDRLDHPNYPKAEQSAYHQIADAMEQSSVNWLSLEDAHRHNDLSLLEQFASTTIILGVVAIAKSDIESVEQITERLQQALQHIDKDRLVAAPDCGLGLLSREQAMAKLRNLSAAAQNI